MKYNHVFAIGCIICILVACQPQGQSESAEAPAEVTQVGNPAMPGFNMEDSDSEAIEVADKVMEAMGGRKNWDDLHYSTWIFFGNRRHIWDKFTGDVKIDYLQDTAHNKSVIFNVNTMEGRVRLDGEVLADADSASKLIQAAKSHWINDMYWVYMPFKMKDDGVTLKYAGQDSTETGVLAEVVEMTFDGVGNTPQNKYHVYVDPTSHMVLQWDYYPNATDEEPRFKSSWEAYKNYDGLKISSDRLFYGGAVRKLEEIAVMDTLETNVFEAF